MINSPRLFLRALETSDVELMYEVENDELSWRYSDTVAPLSRHLLKEYASTYDANPFKSGQLRLIVISKESNIPVGIVDLYEISQRHSRAFVGIYILPEFRNKGYAKETLNLIENFAFQTLHLHQLAAKVEDKNRSSEILFTNNGYEMNAYLKDWLSSTNGDFLSMKIFTKILS